jgi:y4mF family transcriptional regulator
MTPKEIGYEIRQRRKLLRINQSDLARLANCSKPSVIAAENGKATLRLDKLTAILRVLGLTLVVDDDKPRDE